MRNLLEQVRDEINLSDEMDVSVHSMEQEFEEIEEKDGVKPDSKRKWTPKQTTEPVYDPKKERKEKILFVYLLKDSMSFESGNSLT